MSFDVSLTLDHAEIRRLLETPNGPVGRYIEKLGIRTVNEAKKRAPVQTGRLRKSIQITTWPGPGMSLVIAANVNYSLAVHEGTRAHDIEGNPFVAFPSKKSGGKLITVRSVHKKAQKGNPFLVNALRATIPKK